MQLAYLQNAGKIDVIMTEDSDAWVFGGQCLICRFHDLITAYSHLYFSRNQDITDFDKITVYTSARIQEEHLSTEAGILLIAILLGGNYDEVSVFLVSDSSINS